MRATLDVARDEERGQLYVQIRTASDNSADDGSPYDFELAITGVFSLDPALLTSASQAVNLTQLNAPAVLYGIARGYVASATSLAPPGPFLLPVVNLVRALNKPTAQRRPRRVATAEESTPAR